MTVHKYDKVVHKIYRNVHEIDEARDSNQSPKFIQIIFDLYSHWLLHEHNLAKKA